MIMEINVGENSRITDCLAAKAIRVFGIRGLFRLRAVWIATTPPMKKEIKETIPREPIIRSSISLNIRLFKTDLFVIRPKTPFNIKIYSPIECRYFIFEFCKG